MFKKHKIEVYIFAGIIMMWTSTNLINLGYNLYPLFAWFMVPMLLIIAEGGLIFWLRQWKHAAGNQANIAKLMTFFCGALIFGVVLADTFMFSGQKNIVVPEWASQAVTAIFAIATGAHLFSYIGYEMTDNDTKNKQANNENNNAAEVRKIKAKEQANDMQNNLTEGAVNLTRAKLEKAQDQIAEVAARQMIKETLFDFSRLFNVPGLGDGIIDGQAKDVTDEPEEVKQPTRAETARQNFQARQGSPVQVQRPVYTDSGAGIPAAAVSSGRAPVGNQRDMARPRAVPSEPTPEVIEAHVCEVCGEPSVGRVHRECAAWRMANPQ